MKDELEKRGIASPAHIVNYGFKDWWTVQTIPYDGSKW